MILVNSNVLLDFLSPDHREQAWSRKSVAAARGIEPLVVNVIVRAEIAPRFSSIAEQSEFLADLAIETLAIDNAAAFRAGQAFRQYRQSGSKREAILADFLIGAHASLLGARLMTRDRRRFASYFPELTLLSPENDNG